MDRTQKFNILITGKPGVGKTSLLIKIIKQLNLKMTGFITKEIREKKRRMGFKITTLDYKEYLLASKQGKKSNEKVGSYNVYIENLELALLEIEKELKKNKHDIIIIDEIGKMELFSKSFQKFVEKHLNEKRVVATIMLRDNPFTKRLKKRSDTKIFEVTRANRDSIKKDIITSIVEQQINVGI